MTLFRAIWRLVKLLAWIGIGVGLALWQLNVSGARAYSAEERRLIAWWSDRMLTALGVQLRITGRAAPGSVVVANHHTWLDILVVMSASPVRFLSKQEVAEWPVIGWLAKRAGTLFLKRGEGETRAAMQQMQALIHSGDSVLFFPEGTTTNHSPKSFHARLFALPIEMQVDLLPVCIVYHDGTQRRNDIAYIGDQSLLANIWYLVQQRNIVVELTYLPVISEMADKSRGELAKLSHQAIDMQWQQGESTAQIV